MMEHVDGFDSSRTLLLVAKYQIDPLVEMSTHVITLQSLMLQKYRAQQTTTEKDPVIHYGHFYVPLNRNAVKETAINHGLLTQLPAGQATFTCKFKSNH